MRKKWKQKLDIQGTRIDNLIQNGMEYKSRLDNLERHVKALAKPLKEEDKKRAANGEMPLYTEFTCKCCAGIMKANQSVLLKEEYVCTSCQNKMKNGWTWRYYELMPHGYGSYVLPGHCKREDYAKPGMGQWIKEEDYQA